MAIITLPSYRARTIPNHNLLKIFKGTPNNFPQTAVQCIPNIPFSHRFCACLYRSRGPLFLDNRRDFTQMGQTAFRPLMLSMLLVIINRFKHLFSYFFSSIRCLICIFHFPLSSQAKFINPPPPPPKHRILIINCKEVTSKYWQKTPK